MSQLTINRPIGVPSPFSVNTLTLNGVLYGNGTSAILSTSQGPANSILIANAGAPSFSASPTIGTSLKTPLVIGGVVDTSTLTLQSTSGVGATGADIIFRVGNNGSLEAARVLNSGTLRLGVSGVNTGALAIAGVTSGLVTISVASAAGTYTLTLPITGGTTDYFLKTTDGAGTLAFAQVTDALLSTSDITTNDVTISKHGFAPKLPNDATKFFNGTGSYVSTGGILTWNEVVATSATMVAKNGYVANNDGLVTLTLPATAALGDPFEIVGKGTGGWKIAQLAGQTIHFGNVNTATGTGGSLQSTLRYDTISLRCITANVEFIVLDSQGSITIV